MKGYNGLLAVLTGIKIFISYIMFYMAHDVKTNYYMSSIASLNQHVYVANDASNLIINAIYYGTYMICGVLLLISAINFGALLFRRLRSDSI